MNNILPSRADVNILLPGMAAYFLRELERLKEKAALTTNEVDWLERLACRPGMPVRMWRQSYPLMIDVLIAFFTSKAITERLTK